jgi:hypothetical protein
MNVLLFIPVFYCLLIRVLVIAISSSASIVFARTNIPNFSVPGRAICFIQSCKSGGKFSGYIHTYLCQTHGLFEIALICLGDALMTRHASYLDIGNYCFFT